MTLVEFLNARLDEDEAIARAATDGPWGATPGPWGPEATYLEAVDGWDFAVFETVKDARHAARHDPARVLAEVAAKRKIVEEHPIRKSGDEEGCECNYDREWGWAEEGACGTLRALTSVYAGHPDYDPTWR